MSKDYSPASPSPALFAPRDDGRVIDADIVEQAAGWMAMLQSGMASPADKAACLHWRRDRPEHERAWQRMQGFAQDVRAGAAGVPTPLARAALRGAASSRRLVLKSVAGIAITGLGAWTVREQTPWRHWAADQGTGTGEQRTLTLSEGTRVLLGTHTAIDVRFTAEHRQIVLRTGDIMVTTGRDATGRPLSVVTDSGSISPVGTRFTVRHEPAVAPDITRVAVMEGAVDIRTRRSAAALRLVAGQQTRFTSDTITPGTPLVLADTAWTEGMLVAERMRLADFVAELSRYRRGSLRCDPAVADLRVSGAFPLNDPDAVLSLLQETLPVRVRYVGGYWGTVGAL